MSIRELNELISPAFTEEVIFEILNKKKTLTDLKILEIIIDTEASKKGDSYLSTICRFVVKATGINSDGENEPISVPVIVKYFPKNVARQKTFRSADFFKTEIQFYQTVWPEMRKLKSSKMPDEPEDVPLLLACYSDGKNDFVALEDLSFQGFNSCGRNDGTTKEQLSLLLRTLANFHALGVATKIKNPQFEHIASQLTESYFGDRYRPWYENFMYKSMGPHYQTAIKEVLPEKYHDKITELFSRDLYGDVIKCCYIRDKLCTVTEGDAWLPNFLVKCDENRKFIDVVLIDFQLARFAPITNDILQFLYTCVPDEILSKHWDDMISEYHHYLSKRIGELGGDENYITLKDIQDEILRYPLLGVVMAMESNLMSLLTEDEVADIDLLQGNEAIPLEEVWILPKYERSRNERLAFLVKDFVDRGLI